MRVRSGPDPVPARDRREFWREFWRDTVLNRSDADFRPADRRTGFDAGVQGFLGRNSQLRVGQSGAVILRRSAAAGVTAATKSCSAPFSRSIGGGITA